MKSLMPWRRGNDPMAPSRVDAWFNRVWSDPFDDFFPVMSRPFSASLPSVDVSEDNNEVTVKAEIPGMSENDLALTWHNGVLNIRGEKKEEKEDRKKNCYYRECRYGSFSRDIPLGNAVDWSKAKAKYKNGVLSVVLPKAENAGKAREIKVN